jgi:hypothetical protein
MAADTYATGWRTSRSALLQGGAQA